MADRPRTLTYQKAIRALVKPGMTVADLGCGSGILSLLVARQGCRKVYAVDRSSIIDDAEAVARLNGLADRISFVRSDILDFNPPEPVDMVVHELIGYYLWNEGIIEKMAHARSMLKPGTGKILPHRIDLHLAPTDYACVLERSLEFWKKKQYGFSFKGFGEKMFLQNNRIPFEPAIIHYLRGGKLLCKAKKVYTLDLTKASRMPERIEAHFTLKKGSQLRGMLGWFTLHMGAGIKLSTGPDNPATHWGKIFLPGFGNDPLTRDRGLNFFLCPDAEPSKWRFGFDWD